MLIFAHKYSFYVELFEFLLYLYKAMYNVLIKIHSLESQVN